MIDCREHASLRKHALREVYRRSGGNLLKNIGLVELAATLELQPDDMLVITLQMEARDWIHSAIAVAGQQVRIEATGFLRITMCGIEEAEKMERHWLRQFYEDHVVLWSLVVLIAGFALSTASGVVVNLSKTAAPIIINMPEQKPPIVNVTVPDKNK